MCECLVTLATLIWFLPSMNPHVIIKLPFWTKVLSHWLHWYDLSPVCMVIWHVICPFHEKDFLHWGHWYDFSPLYLIMCFVRAILFVNALSHWLHSWYVSSPVCSLIRYVKWHFSGKSLIPLAALVWFITSMSPQINSELNIPWENPAESMYQHMLPRAASNAIQNSTVSFTQISLS